MKKSTPSHKWHQQQRDPLPAKPYPIAYMWREVITDPQTLAKLLGASASLADQVDRDAAITEIKHQLAERIQHYTAKVLTPHQLKLYTLWREGRTQCEIAELMGIQQTSVQKGLFGNVLYTKTIVNPNCPNKTKQKIRLDPPVFVGGIMKKLKLWSESDPVCQQMQQTISDLKAEFIDPMDCE